MAYQNVFDVGAWYLLSYTNTLSFSEWRQTVQQAYTDLERKYGAASAKDNLSKMIAYYCMENAPGPVGRKASSHFRKVHKWQDFRDDDHWWLEEWKSRRQFDLEVSRVKALCASVPSIPPSEVHNDHWGREALSVVLSEARRRIEWDKRSSLNNLAVIENTARETISIFGGRCIVDLMHDGILADRQLIPSLQSMYFLERALVQEYGERLVSLKENEYS